MALGCQTNAPDVPLALTRATPDYSAIVSGLVSLVFTHVCLDPSTAASAVAACTARCEQAMDPFQPAQQLQPSLLTLPTASAAPAAAAGMAGSSWVGPNPAVLQYSTSFGADAGARSSENIAAGAGMRGMTEPAVMLSGSSDPWGTGSRQQPTPKQPAW